ncbi:unnamed protein product [Acanthoscelides obtectus]|uniref:EB domain-containing protein n=1 Tax=Acanthoscelides obtectus TaxID=200917 RepID=A0A9P0KAG4_ACAOB|nr:unnamed protein product [Acanthoscelides obtectus]CAK1676471.1 hypothetical protein AOBTE_LOCUS30778 [Acanthoscelides obtectus]
MNFFVFLVVCVACCCGAQQLEQIVAYSRCRNDADCVKISNNSFCYGNDAGQLGNCKCAEDFELLTRNATHFSCLKYVGYNEPCEIDIQCHKNLSIYAVCKEGKCQCMENAHLYTDGKCYVSLLLEDFCHADGNCYLKNGSFGHCVDGRCACVKDTEVPSQDLTSCVEGRYLGQSCISDDQCGIVDNAVCRVTCKCAVGYALSRDEKRCLKAATVFDDICEESEQCSTFLTGSICKLGNCTCPDGHHGYGSKCVRSVKIGDECNDQSECIPDEKFTNVADCVNRVCSCFPDVENQEVGCGAHWIMPGSILFIMGITTIVFWL